MYQYDIEDMRHETISSRKARHIIEDTQGGETFAIFLEDTGVKSEYTIGQVFDWLGY